MVGIYVCWPNGRQQRRKVVWQPEGKAGNCNAVLHAGKSELGILGNKEKEVAYNEPTFAEEPMQVKEGKVGGVVCHNAQPKTR